MPSGKLSRFPFFSFYSNICTDRLISQPQPSSSPLHHRTRQRNFGASIQEETVRAENVHFPLPKSLRELLPPGSVVSPGAVVNAGARTEPIENTSSVGQVD